MTTRKPTFPQSTACSSALPQRDGVSPIAGLEPASTLQSSPSARIFPSLVHDQARPERRQRSGEQGPVLTRVQHKGAAKSEAPASGGVRGRSVVSGRSDLESSFAVSRRHPQKRRTASPSTRSFSNEEILAAIGNWSRRYGGPPTLLDWEPSRARRMGQTWRAERFEADVWPSARVVCLQFGTFNAAMEAAGFTARRAPSRQRANLSGPEAVLEAMIEWTRRYGDVPTMADWDPRVHGVSIRTGESLAITRAIGRASAPSTCTSGRSRQRSWPPAWSLASRVDAATSARPNRRPTDSQRRVRPAPLSCRDYQTSRRVFAHSLEREPLTTRCRCTPRSSIWPARH